MTISLPSADSGTDVEGWRWRGCGVCGGCFV
jgi:hypothetical protein